MFERMEQETSNLSDRSASSPLDGLLKDVSRRHRILVVDDEPRIVELLKRELGRIYKVLTATSGQEALEVLEKERVVLLVADQRMPGMNGTELMTRVVERCPDTIRILLTGYTDMNALVDAINDGQVYRYISKPWEPEELKIIVKQGIEKYELEHQNRTLIKNLKQINVELKRAMEDLRKAQQELLQAERLSTIGKMTNMIVHDLKNPLTSIMGLSELLITMPMIDSEKRATYYGMIHDESKRILQMVREILEYVRGESLQVSLQPVDIHIFLEEFRQETDAYLSGSLVDLEVDVRWQGSVHLDGKRFKRVLHNLVTNATEAMAEGGKLLLSVTADANYVVLRVADTGPGIPREVQESIFEPFFTRGKEGGSGMGLVIVQRIVEAHQGMVKLESSDRNGTTFCISLPRQLETGQSRLTSMAA